MEQSNLDPVYEEQLKKYFERFQVYNSMRIACISISNYHKGMEISETLAIPLFVFQKMTYHCLSLHHLLPGNSFNLSATHYWDLSSVPLIVRAIMECFYKIAYLSDGSCTPEEIDLRMLLYHYHESCARIKMFSKIKNPFSDISNIQRNKDDLWKKIESNSVFQGLKAKIDQKNASRTGQPKDKTLERLQNGDEACLEDDTKVAVKFGISEGYHQSTYKYLSNMSHPTMFSISHMLNFDMRKPESVAMFATLVEYATCYLALSIKAMRRIAPEISAHINAEIEKQISIWEFVAKES